MIARRHWLAPLALLCTIATAGIAAAQGLEVGYVESIDRDPIAFKILRQGSELPVTLLTPVMNGDRFRIDDPKGNLTLRLVDRTDRLVVSSANQDQPIEARPPEHGFWSGVLSWASFNVDLFDKPDGDQIAANIRAGSKKALVVPLAASAQRLTAGRPLAVGWLSPDVVKIRILADGKPVETGKGVGGLWIGPDGGLAPGAYVLELSTAKDIWRQALIVEARLAAVELPPELERADVPAELREVGAAIWLAAQDDALRLEALGHVAPIADSFRAAGIIADALIAGRRPTPPTR